MGKHILITSDLPGYGKVALAAMLPVLSHLGHHLYSLPTALVSNTLDYGKFDILETTGYMRNTLRVWEELGFSFDAIATGLIVSGEQTELLTDYCASQRKRGTRVYVDPIMGDEGRLYNGVPEETVGYMRRLISTADCILPNYTEAALLAGIPYKEGGENREGMRSLIQKLREFAPGSVIVTSARVDGQNAVAGYDAETGHDFLFPFTEIPVHFPGTGDIFSAVLIGHKENGLPLSPSVQKAMTAVAELIEKNKDSADKFKGIPLETCLGVIS